MNEKEVREMREPGRRAGRYLATVRDQDFVK
jgi:hypothetical protein